jgi:hypothetical protein
VTRTGRCHCSAVRYELEGEVTALVNCHCRDCRRVHGSAFITSTPVASRDLRFVAGEASIRQHGQRYFCSVCGTRLFNRLDDAPHATMLMVSTLDEEPTVAPAMHLNLESKAPWYTIRDAAPTFEAFPPNVDAALRRLEDD